MSATQDQIWNGNGHKELQRNGTARRLNKTHVTLRGVDMTVEYFAEGGYLPATATDPAETPVCVVRHVYVDGVEITALIDDTSVMEDIALAIEGEWR